MGAACHIEKTCFNRCMNTTSTQESEEIDSSQIKLINKRRNSRSVDVDQGIEGVTEQTELYPPTPIRAAIAATLIAKPPPIMINTPIHYSQPRSLSEGRIAGPLYEADEEADDDEEDIISDLSGDDMLSIEQEDNTIPQPIQPNLVRNASTDKWNTKHLKSLEIEMKTELKKLTHHHYQSHSVPTTPTKTYARSRSLHNLMRKEDSTEWDVEDIRIQEDEIRQQLRRLSLQFDA